MNTTLFTTNISPEYHLCKIELDPGYTPAMMFIDAFHDALCGRNAGRLWGEKYVREVSGDGFSMHGFGRLYPHLLIQHMTVSLTKDGVEFWVNGEKDFELSNRQLRRLDGIEFNVKKSSGTLKGILERIGMYIDNFARTREEVYGTCA